MSPEFANSADLWWEEAPPRYPGCTEPLCCCQVLLGHSMSWRTLRSLCSEPSLCLATGQTMSERVKRGYDLQQPCIRYPETLNFVPSSFFSLLNLSFLGSRGLILFSVHVVPSAWKVLPVAAPPGAQDHSVGTGCHHPCVTQCSGQ